MLAKTIHTIYYVDLLDDEKSLKIIRVLVKKFRQTKLLSKIMNEDILGMSILAETFITMHLNRAMQTIEKNFEVKAMKVPTDYQIEIGIEYFAEAFSNTLDSIEFNKKSKED